MNRKTDPVTLWLFLCCGMIFVMALLGAVTRLTESGLSITSWAPLLGALPPMSAEAWNKAFADYQTIPQYQIFNRGMSLDEFKHIYFWEWFHRLWGRLIGLVFALPLIYFFVAKKISRAFFLKLAGIFALGGLQGFIGWFMVMSGLEVRTTVSPYRLALHLGFALLLYALLLWVGLKRNREGKTPQYVVPDARSAIRNPARPPRRRGERMSLCRADARPLDSRFRGNDVVIVWHGWAALGLLAITILWGALTAGLRAGGAYNAWPLMDGAILPGAAWSLQPAWLNFFENTALVQFTHRWLGPATFLMILAWVARGWRGADEMRKRWLLALAVMSAIQVGLGLGTLLSRVQIIIAVTHQAGAILLLTLMLINLQSFYGRRTGRK
jgi:heme a synthase